jgi:diguanylate cyclase
VLIDDFARAQAILRRLKVLGVNIAMDDFGIGCSSLSYLRSFPFDKIKIDRSFISDLEKNNNNVAIIRAVITLSRTLRLPVLAEGVETEAQRLILSREGCDQIQGHLVGVPSPIRNYEAIVNTPQIHKETHKSDQADDKISSSPLHKRIKPARRTQVH